MRLGVWGWAALVTLVISGLAARVVWRPGADAGSIAAGDIAAGDAQRQAAPLVRLETVAHGFTEPVDLQFVPGSPGLAVVLEKQGRARLVQLAAEAAAPGGPASPGAEVLALEVHSSSELGLLGWAFHPRYRENGLFYLNDNPRDSGALRTRISEWQLPHDALGKQPPRLLRVLLEIEQPFQNHDGGQVVFGPDGYLYIGMGDGGSRADPYGNGQNLGTLLGKMLRIDVDARPTYAVPPDNPFLNTAGARPEIWAYGMRNPWRFAFDPRGRLIAGDVGQDRFEEVDWIARGDNQGWNAREGAHCFLPADGCPSAGMVDPILEYGRDAGNSITGGQVYLGRIPWLRDKYVFGDFATGRLWALELPEQRGASGKGELLGRFPHAFSAFARDANGEVYALDFTRGLILRLAGA
jgi:glucose/arabinose dehydrogenase